MICPPVWLCRCGCGGVTTLIKKNSFTKGYIKGEYMMYISGHNGRGKSRSPETRKKQSDAQSGDRHWNWQGGKAARRLARRTFPYSGGNPNQAGRWTPEARKWRADIFERDNYTCWDCGRVGGKLNAHHLKPWAKYPELRFVLTNGITVCTDPCHKIRTKREGR